VLGIGFGASAMWLLFSNAQRKTIAGTAQSCRQRRFWAITSGGVPSRQFHTRLLHLGFNQDEPDARSMPGL